MRFPDDIDLAADPSERWDRGRLCYRDYAGQRLQSRQQTPEKLVFVNSTLVLTARERQSCVKKIVRLETEVDLLQAHEAAHQQSGARQHHQRKGYLEDHERIPQPAVTEAAAD